MAAAVGTESIALRRVTFGTNSNLFLIMPSPGVCCCLARDSRTNRTSASSRSAMDSTQDRRRRQGWPAISSCDLSGSYCVSGGWR